MSKEHTEKTLKVELGFDPSAVNILNEMKSRAKTESTERLIFDALRCYDWYLREGRAYPLYQKRDNQWFKVELEFKHYT